MVRLRNHRSVVAARSMHEVPEPVREPTELDVLIRHLANSPRRCWILEYVTAAHEMGYDVTDPTVLRRAIAAGEKAGAQSDERYSQPSTVTTTEQFVYYMRMSNLVKIGTTGNLRKRVAALRPEAVLAVEYGGRTLEQRRHRQFASHRSHGEWFHMHDRLGEHIDTVRGAFEDATGQPFPDWLKGLGASGPPPASHQVIRDMFAA